MNARTKTPSAESRSRWGVGFQTCEYRIGSVLINGVVWLAGDCGVGDSVFPHPATLMITSSAAVAIDNMWRRAFMTLASFLPYSDT